MHEVKHLFWLFKCRLYFLWNPFPFPYWVFLLIGFVGICYTSGNLSFCLFPWKSLLKPILTHHRIMSLLSLGLGFFICEMGERARLHHMLSVSFGSIIHGLIIACVNETPQNWGGGGYWNKKSPSCLLPPRYSTVTICIECCSLASEALMAVTGGGSRELSVDVLLYAGPQQRSTKPHFSSFSHAHECYHTCAPHTLLLTCFQ